MPVPGIVGFPDQELNRRRRLATKLIGERLRMVEMSFRAFVDMHSRETAAPTAEAPGSVAADALPRCLENGERGLVEQVGHDRSLHAAGERVPGTGRAVVEVEAPVDERLDGLQL